MDKIIVVDDNPDFLGLISQTLGSTFEIDFATSSASALELITANDYKAIILDMSLPDFTGYYLGQLIRKKAPQIPLAFLTNYDGETTRDNVGKLEAEIWKKTDVVSNLKSLGSKIKNLYE